MLLLLTCVSNPLLAADRLSAIESVVALRFAVSDLEAADLQQRLQSKLRQPLLFDTRTSEEFAVSHLPEAMRIDADTTPAAFIARFGTLLPGQELVFYCSVGMRSASLASQLEATLLQHGVRSVRNLRGGIFRWQASGYPMFNSEGQTDAVHPYNRRWGKLVPAGGRISTRPVPPKTEGQP